MGVAMVARSLVTTWLLLAAGLLQPARYAEAAPALAEQPAEQQQQQMNHKEEECAVDPAVFEAPDFGRALGAANKRGSGAGAFFVRLGSLQPASSKLQSQ